jgi:hypothetical protein
LPGGLCARLWRSRKKMDRDTQRKWGAAGSVCGMGKVKQRNITAMRRREVQFLVVKRRSVDDSGSIALERVIAGEAVCLSGQC